MHIRQRLEVSRFGGVLRVIARTAAFVREGNRLERNPEPVREYVQERAFTEYGEAWRLAPRVEHALKAEWARDLRYWDVFDLGQVPADRLLPPEVYGLQ